MLQKGEKKKRSGKRKKIDERKFKKDTTHVM
jgi:hypothetical protein